MIKQVKEKNTSSLKKDLSQQKEVLPELQIAFMERTAPYEISKPKNKNKENTLILKVLSLNLLPQNRKLVQN